MTTPIITKAEPDTERLEACRAYVQSVVDSGDDISIVLNPAWLKRHGGKAMIYFHIGVGDRKDDAPPPSRDHDFSAQEFVAVLEPLGKVHDWRKLWPWNFGNSAVDRRPFGEIIGERLKEAREALGMDFAAFYGPAGMTEKTAEKWEGGQIAGRFQTLGERRFKALSEAHGIPELWLHALDQLDKRWAEDRKEAANGH